MSFANVGKRWSVDSFAEYLKTVKRPVWAKSVTIHHTAAPSLRQRPDGLTAQHIVNIRDYYQKTLGWSRGPHLFVDDDDIMGMTPLTMTGTHAVSFNASSIGIEMLGDFDIEDPKSGRGLQVCRTGAAATRVLLDWLGLKASEKTVLFHRDDPKTTKTCPGKKIAKDWFLGLISNSKAILPAPNDSVPAMVPVVAYVSTKTGRPIADLAKILRRDGSLYYLGEQWLEGAHYDTSTQTTMAPRSEADEAVAALLASSPVGLVPVVATMATRLGIPYAAAAARLVHRDGVFLWTGVPIRGAVYDKASQTTVAPASSLP